MSIYSTPLPRTGSDTRSIFKRSSTGLNSEFFFLIDRLPHQGRRFHSVLLFTHCWEKNSWIHFFAKIIKYKIQTALSWIWIYFTEFISNDANRCAPNWIFFFGGSNLSRIWTQVTVFIFSDDNPYTTSHLQLFFLMTYSFELLIDFNSMSTILST